jgi:Transposase zinc-binding domain/Putative transposase
VGLDDSELGAEVYSSENQELIVYHTCKSPACPSCGHRGNRQWLRERWAALPNTNFKGVTFTMPDLLWPFFRDNQALARVLPALAAEVIRSQVGIRHGVRVGVIAILHTFNGRLEFNSHVHTMVTGGGLQAASNTWTPRVYSIDEGLAEGRDRASPRSPAGGPAPTRANS